MEEISVPERWVVSAPASVVGDRIAKACALAREISGFAGLDFAARLTRVLGRDISAQGVMMVEQGLVVPAADYLIACGLVAQTLLSVLTGELDIDEGALDRLSAEIWALQNPNA